MEWEWWHLYAILAAVVGVAVYAFFFLKKKMRTKMDDQKDLVDQHKVTTSILVLEKRKDKVSKANMPKSVIAQIPSIYKMRKIPIVKAKIGQQVMDLLCDEDVFMHLPEKKNVKVEMAGIFIAGISKKGKK